MSTNIRQQIVQKRQQLAAHTRRQAEKKVNNALIQMIEENGFTRIGVYLAIKRELSLCALILWLHAQQREVYAPKIDIPEPGQMQFFRLHPRSQLESAGFGLREPPASSETISPRQLELVCVPVLGFHGLARMGWGKGYYDRCFSFRKKSAPPPLLAGVTFALQEHQDIKAQSWDVAMDCIISS